MKPFETLPQMLKRFPEWQPYWEEILQIAEITEKKALTAPYNDFDTLTRIQDAMYEIVVRYPERNIIPIDTLAYKESIMWESLHS